MNLILDQGNTLCKIACVDSSDNFVYFQVVDELTPAFLKECLSTYTPQNAILSTVKTIDNQLLALLEAELHTFVHLGPDTPLPIRNGYGTPSTLGFDRLAAAVGAWSQQPGKPLIVIDMGTAITYDFVSRDGTFTGGNIAPGMQTRFKSLNQFTGKLPLVEPTQTFEVLGSTTETAIRSGVMQGILFELDGYIDALKLRYPDLFAFLTGGDLFYFDRKLKNGIFVDDKLVLKGLNRILRHNVHS
jgi:type III pantothenate kinase